MKLPTYEGLIFVLHKIIEINRAGRDFQQLSSPTPARGKTIPIQAKSLSKSSNDLDMKDFGLIFRVLVTFPKQAFNFILDLQ